jgi:hypothetical protein
MQLVLTWKATRRTQRSFSYAQAGTVCFRFQLLAALLNRPTHTVLLSLLWRETPQRFAEPGQLPLTRSRCRHLRETRVPQLTPAATAVGLAPDVPRTLARWSVILQPQPEFLRLLLFQLFGGKRRTNLGQLLRTDNADVQGHFRFREVTREPPFDHPSKRIPVSIIPLSFDFLSRFILPRAAS